MTYKQSRPESVNRPESINRPVIEVELTQAHLIADTKRLNVNDNKSQA